ncbi:hypothetical protein [Streptomyces lanatus]|uniref:Alcohol dehydrogenase n=1 Tax=Streptomyces lanatus TaxID=66900 RepID=A0ABV1Y3N2_9ACTN|nr:hypothetical protein [Streptomyces lanatus]GHH27245.1 hypothetical protein GCM10018780_81910 [Streptomyces lanatus]
MSVQTQAAVIRGKGAVELEDVLVRNPGADEVLVRIESSGICRTDLESLPLVAGALAVASGPTRVMALPAVEQLLDRVGLGLVDDDQGGSA